MKAVVFHGADKGLKVEDIPVPEIGDDQILVKVAACGVCHTDLHYIEHGVPTFKKPPIVLYPDECWYCGCCVQHCPVWQKGAIRMNHPMAQRVGWKRKETGEHFRIGMHDPPPPNTKPPVGGWKAKA